MSRSRPLHSIVSRANFSRAWVRRALAVGLAVAVVGTTAACGSDSNQPLSLPDLLITTDQMPANFTIATMTVDDLIKANRATLEQSATVAFDPPECAPTSDAAFNPQLNEGNSALLVGRTEEATFSELVSSVRRDIDADRRATTGPCRVVTATPSKGSLSAAKIVTTTTELPTISDPAVEQAFLVRSDSVTTLPNSQVRSRVGLIGNVLVKRSTGEVVTLQVGVSSLDTEGQATAPVSDEEFVRLVSHAVARAAR